MMICDSCRFCGKRLLPRHAKLLLEFVGPCYPESRQINERLSASFNSLLYNTSFVIDEEEDERINTAPWKIVREYRYTYG